MEQLQKFRQEIDEFMHYNPQSPLDHDQRHQFTGLNYYEVNEKMILEVEVEPFPNDEPTVIMETNTGDRQEYRPFGKFSFAVGEDEATLTLYADAHGGYFLPFKDSTNGRITYGAGRYLDDHRPAIQRLEGNRFQIDFNYAYNPYCAYSPAYSCPLPPPENWLKVPIRAGEKNFEK